jgi:hypothetical protein
MTVAMVAQLDLLNLHPDVFQICEGILLPLSGVLTHGQANTFVESACWPDLVKTFSFEAFNSAHYIDRPYNPQGMVNATGPETNIVWAINNILNTLQGQTAQTAPLETSMALRYLIHFLGDLHQPLHATTLWSNVFPNGDQGGNLFPIEFNSDIKELHALWDSCIGVYENDMQLPMNESAWQTVEQWAKWAMGNYTRQDLAIELQVTDFNKISIESYLKAVTYAYEGIEYGGTPSQEYLETRFEVVQKQLALGGYRLSDALVRALKPGVDLKV